MGRELKRVALDFVWPLGIVWEGFKNPWYAYCKPCPSCKNGYSPDAEVMYDQWYGNAPFTPAKPFTSDNPAIVRLAKYNVASPTWDLYCGWTEEQEIDRLLRTCFNNHWGHHLSQVDVDALVKEGRLSGFDHHPTADEVNQWSLVGFGHDSINCGIVIEARCKRENKPLLCPVCNGTAQRWDVVEGHDPEKESENWEGVQPPSGEGYQIWETTSEGSPMSPVFSTPEELARWMEKNDTSITEGTTYDQWMKFILGSGWSPSIVVTNGKVQTGVVAMTEDES